MKNLKTYQKFLLKENIDIESQMTGNITLYRLTSHPVVDLSAPGEFYVKSMEDLNPDFLENKEGDQLYVITVNCPNSNINSDQSEVECAKHNCECIVSVNDDKKCEVIKVEPYKN